MRLPVLSLLAVLLLSLSLVHADSLGRIEFPVTGPAIARAHFLRGALALHSFFYDEALDEFRASTKVEPRFSMGYWGEAMALNQTIWAEQDLEGARRALAKIPADAKLTPKERAWIEAVRVLYGDGNKPARDSAYARIMEKMARSHPDDLEAQSFWALSLLGLPRPGEPGIKERMLAGAISQEVLKKNPEHPGAAHYAIHAFDDADHAPLGLPAAQRYAKIAPEAFHARHMPAHIYVNLGRWEESAASCEAAWAASEAWVARRKHDIAKKDYHSLEWLVHIYHQQGRAKKAEEMLRLFGQAAEQSPDPRLNNQYLVTVASYVRRTGAWDCLDGLLAPVRTRPPAQAETKGAGCHPTQRLPTEEVFQHSYSRVRAFQAAAGGDGKLMEKHLTDAATRGKKLAGTPFAEYLAAESEIGALVAQAQLAVVRKRFTEAEVSLRRAIVLQQKQPFRGAANPAGGALETVLGRALLLGGKTKEAAQAYGEALRLTPGDSVALLGAARAALRLGDEAAAAAHYRKLAAQWSQADPDFPDLAEVRQHQGAPAF